jgi:hypothetical protein
MALHAYRRRRPSGVAVRTGGRRVAGCASPSTRPPYVRRPGDVLVDPPALAPVGPKASNPCVCGATAGVVSCALEKNGASRLPNHCVTGRA